MFPVEFISTTAPSVSDSVDPADGRFTVPFTTCVPAPRRKTTFENGNNPLSTNAPGVVSEKFPLYVVTPPVAALNCTIALPDTVTGPLIATAPDVFIPVRKLNAAVGSAEVKFNVVAAGRVTPPPSVRLFEFPLVTDAAG